MECNGSVPSPELILVFSLSKEREPIDSTEWHIPCLCRTKFYLRIKRTTGTARLTRSSSLLSLHGATSPSPTLRAPPPTAPLRAAMNGRRRIRRAHSRPGYPSPAQQFPPHPIVLPPTARPRAAMTCHRRILALALLAIASATSQAGAPDTPAEQEGRAALSIIFFSRAWRPGSPLTRILQSGLEAGSI